MAKEKHLRLTAVVCHGAARRMGQLRALIWRQQLMHTGCLQFNARTPAECSSHMQPLEGSFSMSLLST